MTNKHYRILVLRLLVDQQGNLQRGEVVDVNRKHVGHFQQLLHLPNLVDSWLHKSIDERG